MNTICSLNQKTGDFNEHTFECKDTAIITMSRIKVQVMKNILRTHLTFGTYKEYIKPMPHKEAM